jgi:transposase
MALAGIVHVLRTGVAWRDVPASMIGRSGVTCRRWLRDWADTEVWPCLHALPPAKSRAAGLLDR